MEDRIIVIEGETFETKIMIEIVIDHMRDKIETGEIVEALVTVDQDRAQDQLQIGIGLDVSSVGSITIL